MAEEFVRYFDVDGNKRPIAASNLKRSGRLVIGIAGTHTLDDADILFGASESDASANSVLLEEAQAKGGFGELFFLAGRFYVHGGFSCNDRTIRGSSRNSAGYYDGSSNHATYIVNTEDWGYGGILSGDNCRICDLTITSTDTAYNSEESTRVGFYCDYGENSVLENVTFEKIRGTAIHIYEGYGITVINCIVKSDCGTGIYCSDGKYVTISDCDVSSSVSIDSNNQTENPVYVFSNKFNGDCTLYNCYAENNLIKGAFSGTDNFTTIGATKLTEDKVKALNKIPNEFGKTWSIVIPNDYSNGDMLSYDFTAGLYAVSILYDETNDTPLASALFKCTDSDGQTMMTVYPMDDEFDYGIISIHIGNWDLYIYGEDRLIQWLHGKRITFTRIL